MVIAASYLLLVPSVVPNTEFLRENALNAIGFILLNGCVAANLLTDAVFIAYRRTQYNILVDGVILGLTRLGCLGGFVGLTAYVIFASSGIGGAIAVVASLCFMVWRVDYHPRLRIDFAVLTGSP